MPQNGKLHTWLPPRTHSVPHREMLMISQRVTVVYFHLTCALAKLSICSVNTSEATVYPRSEYLLFTYYRESKDKC